MTIPHVVPGVLITAAEQNDLIDQVNETAEAVGDLVAASDALPYTHNQNSAAATWSGSHNLGRYPRAVVLDSDRNVMIADIQYPTINTFVVVHASPVSGSIHFL